MATPICALAACMLASACSTSGRCATSAEGRLSGRSWGRREAREREPLIRQLGREAAGEDGDEMLLLLALLEQRRQRCLELLQLRLLRGHVGACRIALRLLVLEQAQHLAIDADQLVGRIDLVVERGLLDDRVGDIGAERDVDRNHLVAARLFLRGERLDRSLVQAEHVGRIGDAELRRDQSVEGGVVAGDRGERSRRVLFARDARACADLWKVVRRAAQAHSRGRPAALPALP